MRNRRTLSQTTALAVVTAGLVGCAGSRAYPGLDVEPGAATVLEVTNNNWSDVKIYAVRGATKFRLGSVNSFSTTRLRVPAALTSVNELRLRVELIGSRAAYTTESFPIGPSSVVSWVINDHLPLSRLAVRY